MVVSNIHQNYNAQHTLGTPSATIRPWEGERERHLLVVAINIYKAVVLHDDRGRKLSSTLQLI
jgi:hypothetical protein